MMRILSDEESIAFSEQLVAKVTEAFVMTRISHPETSIEALSQVLFMVNGPDWMSPTDIARARVAARGLAMMDKPR